MSIRIKELAERLHISTRTIRFYEEKGLLKPDKDSGNQYRRFSDNELWRLQTIISLREIGLSLREIKQALAHIEEGNDGELRHYLELQRTATFTQWLELKQLMETTDRMIELLDKQGTLAPEDAYPLAESSKRLRIIRSRKESAWNFDPRASYYDELVRSGVTASGAEVPYDEALEHIAGRLDPQPGEVGLDIGTGTGNLAGKLLARGAVMSAIDSSKEMLKLCRNKFPGLETRHGNFLAIPYLDAHFDFVATSFAYHYLTEEQRPVAVSEMLRVLKQGGRLCISDFMFDDAAHKRQFLAGQQRDNGLGRVLPEELDNYAYLSELRQELEEAGCSVSHETYSPLLRVVYARKQRV
ncbi:putative AdoMet-dependent methyltransferase [Paenibacillus sp. UNCCL117]|uniref:MerR family transcriptional regulator n=1 Tax=unclassified Paenibacillus TaxID=185978 RepID=UPI0008822A54|nr:MULTISPECIES: MerR family transcriptional regulator [unclassified Paenibacillus]SDC74610.1 putative AdoMet-dependent methyltransferase [Paenibacillus sp. cl123]SFW25262.1 putative AdoMet-dependent methyltransferase [Paenibacillus sp. UNCCL117]